MDIQKYIASGVLESYLMGELDEEEMKRVDHLIESYPELSDELEQLRNSINQFAKASGKVLDKRMLDQVYKEIGDSSKSTVDFHAQEPLHVTKSKKIPVWSIAASFLLLVSLSFNIYFMSRLQTLVSEKDLLAGQAETTSQKLEYANLRIAHFLNEDNIHVRMDGLEISPESFANVFWNKKTNAVFISVDNLPQPPHGHQYQLWAIKEGQPPIDAGIFDHNNLIQELKVIRGDVQAFAVTLEKEGGTPNATIDKTYVKGLLKKS